MRILALDQATQTGWAVGDQNSFERKTVDKGVFRMPKRPAMGERLLYFRNGLLERIDHFKPDLIAHEEPYWPHQSAPAGTISVGYAKALVLKVSSGAMTKGAALADLSRIEEKEPAGQISADMLQFLQMVKGQLIEVAAERGVPVESYASSTWRKTALGMGRAPKGSEKGILKKMMMAKAKALGFPCETEDEAEAIGILLHALHGAPAAERAQGDLLEMAQARL